MASPVDTSVKNFNNTMAAAPALSGTPGAFIALLDAVLVNGFDVKTASSLTIAGGVATLEFTGAHSAQVDSVLTLSGIAGLYAALNGEQKVTAIAAGLVRFATTMADGVASGTVSFKMAPAGWEKVYAGANKGVYRSLDPMSTKMLLRVDDTAATAARVIGYESMTDVDTGVGPFPTPAQVNGGGYWPKSTGSNATAVPWAIHADSRLLAHTVQFGVATNAAYLGAITRVFGDMIAFRPGGDNYLCGLNYSVQSSIINMTEAGLFSSNGGAGMATPRAYTGLGSSSLHAMLPYVGANSLASGVDATLGAFPNIVDGSLQLSKRFIAFGGVPRGDVPGAYSVPQTGLYETVKQLDRVPGAGALAGRTLQAVATFTPGTQMATTSNNNNTGVAFFDITGPWR